MYHTACIDYYGNLVGLTSTNSCIFPVEAPIIGHRDFDCEYSISYVISGVNKEINFEPEGF